MYGTRMDIGDGASLEILEVLLPGWHAECRW